jgi:repressor LexA
MLDSGRKLSDKQQRILEYIREYVEEHPYPPSVREIQQACKISSTSVVDYNLRLLQRDGIIRRSPEISRGIELVGAAGRSGGGSRRSEAALPPNIGIPVLGYVAAGEPLPVFSESFEAEPMEVLDLPQSLLPRGKQVFALRVKGQSMIDALIDDGDIVLFESVNEARDGDMVVAWLKEESETTLKRLYREKGRVRLQPANSQMDPIYASPENVAIQGKVVGAIRILG